MSPRKLTENDVTPESVFTNRRRILKGLGIGGGAALATSPLYAQGLWDRIFGSDEEVERPTTNASGEREPALTGAKPLTFINLQKEKPKRELTDESAAVTHNNFYEFGTQKNQPFVNAKDFEVEPWTLTIEGEVEKPITIDVWEMINSTALEERIYRFRCVEAWSMVIPWIGIELNQLIKQANPTSRAKFVAFETLYDPEQMPGQKNRRLGGGIDYPYVEGLRMDEAMHPLTIMTVGMYGRTLPPQNGAPLRLMSPWKYGFKAIKSIVKIRLQETMPPTTWNILAPHEYGFYANVNPEVDHPRWSQASERFITSGGLTGVSRIPTEMFNGYAEEVASLYSGMDLRRWY